MFLGKNNLNGSISFCTFPFSPTFLLKIFAPLARLCGMIVGEAETHPLSQFTV